MKRRTHLVDPKLERARQMFERWRTQRRKRGPVPEDLWQSAVALARQYGVCRVSRELRLNYERLRARVKAPAPSPRAMRPAFVEVEVPQPPWTGECAIDIENARGQRITLRIKGHNGPELVAALGKVFFDHA